jgi:hypothetical protein
MLNSLKKKTRDNQPQTPDKGQDRLGGLFGIPGSMPRIAGE